MHDLRRRSKENSPRTPGDAPGLEKSGMILVRDTSLHNVSYQTL